MERRRSLAEQKNWLRRLNYFGDENLGKDGPINSSKFQAMDTLQHRYHLYYLVTVGYTKLVLKLWNSVTINVGAS